ncbi:MAG: hypothetical protein LBV02_00600, partial [Bacteroidales bacterium]|nr:hypothetical protein [Bacteroidales bacterium]
MNKFKKKVFWILGISLPILAVTAILLLKNSHYDIVEQMKKGTAKIRKVEYIPNQNFQMEERLVFHQKDSIYDDFRSQF